MDINELLQRAEYICFNERSSSLDDIISDARAFANENSGKKLKALYEFIRNVELLNTYKVKVLEQQQHINDLIIIEDKIKLMQKGERVEFNDDGRLTPLVDLMMKADEEKFTKAYDKIAELKANYLVQSRFLDERNILRDLRISICRLRVDMQ